MASVVVSLREPTGHDFLPRNPFKRRELEQAYAEFRKEMPGNVLLPARLEGFLALVHASLREVFGANTTQADLMEANALFFTKAPGMILSLRMRVPGGPEYYKLDELVLDTPAMLKDLAKGHMTKGSVEIPEGLRSQGFGAEVLEFRAEFSRKIGLDYLGARAAYSHGRARWLSSGFVPDQRSWDERIQARIGDFLASGRAQQAEPELLAFLETLRTAKNPEYAILLKAIRAVPELGDVGKQVLLSERDKPYIGRIDIRQPEDATSLGDISIAMAVRHSEQHPSNPGMHRTFHADAHLLLAMANRLAAEVGEEKLTEVCARHGTTPEAMLRMVEENLSFNPARERQGQAPYAWHL
jgi:hypothetical protein